MRLNYLLFLLLFIAPGCLSCGNGGGKASLPATAAQQEKDSGGLVARVPLADPFILLHNGTYYAYGTGAANGIAVMTSEDLTGWVGGKGNAGEGLALHKDDVWGEKWFWAPEVYLVDGKFYMYYTAEEHICVATADSPLGPFVQGEQKPMIAGEKCIDNTLFIDDDGKPYMYYDRFNDGLNIWVAELEADLTTIRPGTGRKCISVSQQWEMVWPRVNEGSFVVKSNGIYYMTYSANSYESPFYGIGCATAASPLGPWIKYEDNPLLQKPDGLVGVGHSAMFRDKAGDLRIVFHAHRDSANIHPRHMYLSSVSFRYQNGSYRMEIDKNYITPQAE